MMKVLIRIWKVMVIMLGVVTMSSLLTSSPVHAVPLTFHLDVGGVVSYAGGTAPFLTTGGVVTSVSGGVVTQSIINGSLNLETGNSTGVSFLSGTGFISEFAGGGSLTITGNAGGGLQTLLEGAFSGNSYFNCCTSGGSSTFNGSLSISMVDPVLAALFGFELPPVGGSIAQFQIVLNPSPANAGDPFSGIQGGGQVFVEESAYAVPEPMTFVLLGSGLLGLGMMLRRKELPK